MSLPPTCLPGEYLDSSSYSVHVSMNAHLAKSREETNYADLAQYKGPEVFKRDGSILYQKVPRGKTR